LVGSISITNTMTSALNGWTIEFDLPQATTNIWNATIVSHSGNHYVIRNAAWNATVAAGGAVTAADSWRCRTLVMLRLPPGKPPRLR
jgi:endoglucanase